MRSERVQEKLLNSLNKIRCLQSDGHLVKSLLSKFLKFREICLIGWLFSSQIVSDWHEFHGKFHPTPFFRSQSKQRLRFRIGNEFLFRVFSWCYTGRRIIKSFPRLFLSRLLRVLHKPFQRFRKRWEHQDSVKTFFVSKSMILSRSQCEKKETWQKKTDCDLLAEHWR